EHGSRVGHLVKEVLVVGVTALVISFLIKTFLVQAFWIPSGSMENTLVYGDRVLVSKLQLGPGQIERGDIAVFHDPGGWLPPRVGARAWVTSSLTQPFLGRALWIPSGSRENPLA